MRVIFSDDPEVAVSTTVIRNLHPIVLNCVFDIFKYEVNRLWHCPGINVSPNLRGPLDGVVDKLTQSIKDLSYQAQYDLHSTRSQRTGEDHEIDLNFTGEACELDMQGRLHIRANLPYIKEWYDFVFEFELLLSAGPIIAEMRHTYINNVLDPELTTISFVVKFYIKLLSHAAKYMTDIIFQREPKSNTMKLYEISDPAFLKDSLGRFGSLERVVLSANNFQQIYLHLLAMLEYMLKNLKKNLI